MKHWFKMWSGAAVSYFVIAACSGGGNGGSGHDASAGMGGAISTGGSGGVAGLAQGGAAGQTGAGGAQDGSAAGGGQGGSGGAFADVVDAVLDPVREAAAEVYQSGTRLRARYLAADDGTKQFVGWRDTQLGLDCAFFPAADGKTRCIPSGVGASIFFTDASCTQAVMIRRVGSCEPVQAFQFHFGPVVCTDPLPTVYRVGAQLATDPPTVYQSDASGCGQVSFTGYEFYAATEEPAPSFVAAVEQVE